MMNCLVSVIINETEPLPKDSYTPDITIANVEKIKLSDKIRNPLVPIDNISWLALKSCKIGAGKIKNKHVPSNRIVPIVKVAIFSV